MVIEKAKRLVEHGKDVVILLDSITRMGRPPAHRTHERSTGATAPARPSRARTLARTAGSSGRGSGGAWGGGGAGASVAGKVGRPAMPRSRITWDLSVPLNSSKITSSIR